MQKLLWKPLSTEQQVNSIIERSHEVPCLIFKHSTRCEISSIAKYRLEDDWAFTDQQIEAYYLDLINFRSISQHITETFEVHHESPQVLLISQGACIYDASHLDITVPELAEALPLVGTN